MWLIVNCSFFFFSVVWDMTRAIQHGIQVLLDNPRELFLSKVDVENRTIGTFADFTGDYDKTPLSPRKGPCLPETIPTRREVEWKAL